MRFVQGTLLLVGLTALGFGGGGLLAYGFLKAVFPEPQGENWGGAHIWLLLIAFGCLMGLVVGLAIAVRRLLRREMRDWSVATWTGIAIGFAIGLVMILTGFERYHDWFWAIIAAFALSAYATIGGVIGRVVAARRSAKPRSSAKRDAREL